MQNGSHSVSNSHKKKIKKLDLRVVSHTPGPWHTAFPCSSELLSRTIRDENDVRVADVGFGYEDQSREIANARLIAAAPDLLNALEVAEATIKRLAKTDSDGTLDVIRAAITKVEGR